MIIDVGFAVELACIAFVVGLTVRSWFRHRKTYAKAEQTYEAAAAQWEEVKQLREHAQELDRLLAQLCVQAYANAHLPIWKAWGVMGTISVTAERELPTELD